MISNSGGRKRSRGPAFGEAPVEKQTTLTDEHIKQLLEKQICKSTSIPKELERPKNFVDSVVVKDNTSKRAGMRTLVEFKELASCEQEETTLREHGLTDEEISLMLNRDKHNRAHEEHYKARMKIINAKISKHKEQLVEQESYANGVSVNRRELETEQATHHGVEGKSFSHLIQYKPKEYSVHDPVIATLKEYERKQKQDECEDEEEEEEDCEEEEERRGFIGPMLSNVNERVEAIPEELIFRNRVSLTDIHKLEKFKNYKAGKPSKVLYIKNLAKDVTEKDLSRLFSRYYVKDQHNVVYKIMTGRMHGQAFVTFHDDESAMEALLLCNGYKLYDKPMIIAYGKPRE